MVKSKRRVYYLKSLGAYHEIEKRQTIKEIIVVEDDVEDEEEKDSSEDWVVVGEDGEDVDDVRMC
jgi:hypothetical protein